jgi:hypothetical protein
MKNTSRKILFLSAFFAASALYAATSPTVDITVKAGHKIVREIKTDANGNFTIGTLPAGYYTLEFRARKSAALKNQQFSIAVDGIKTSGRDDAVSGQYLVGGVALDVQAVAGRRVSGQVTTGAAVALKNTKKRMVWLPPELGSNLPGHWVEAGSSPPAPARHWGYISLDEVRKWQDHGDIMQ